MVYLICGDVAKAMGCQLLARPKSDQLFIWGVEPGDIPVKYNAIFRLQIPRARLVISRYPDTLSTKELRLANKEEEQGGTLLYLSIQQALRWRLCVPHLQFSYKKLHKNIHLPGRGVIPPFGVVSCSVSRICCRASCWRTIGAPELFPLTGIMGARSRSSSPSCREQVDLGGQARQT